MSAVRRTGFLTRRNAPTARDVTRGAALRRDDVVLKPVVGNGQSPALPCLFVERRGARRRAHLLAPAGKLVADGVVVVAEGLKLGRAQAFLRGLAYAPDDSGRAVEGDPVGRGPDPLEVVDALPDGRRARVLGREKCVFGGVPDQVVGPNRPFCLFDVAFGKLLGPRGNTLFRSIDSSRSIVCASARERNGARSIRTAPLLGRPRRPKGRTAGRAVDSPKPASARRSGRFALLRYAPTRTASRPSVMSTRQYRHSSRGVEQGVHVVAVAATRF